MDRLQQDGDVHFVTPRRNLTTKPDGSPKLIARVARASRAHYGLALQLLGFATFATYRFTQGLRIPAVWQDSEAYRAVSLHPWLSGALWAGARAPLVPVLFKLSGGQYYNYAVAQTVIGVMAWGFLAWTASTFVAPGWRRAVITWAVLAFATAPLVVQWDWSVLSESPSLSALAVLCACGLLLVRRFSWIVAAGLTLAAAAYVGFRDADIWTVGIVGLVLMVVGLERTIRGAAVDSTGLAKSLRRTAHDRWPRTRRTVFVGVALLAVSIVAGAGANASHRNVQNVEEAFYVRIFPFPDRVSWFSAVGMPEADQVDALAKTSRPATSTYPQIVAPDLTDPAWAPLQRWFADDGLKTYALFLATHPTYVLLAPFSSSPPLTYNNASGQLSFYDPLGHDSLSPFEDVFVPNKYVVMVLAAIGLLVAWRRRTLARPELRFLIAFAVIGLFSMLLAWHGEGMEVTRHMVEGNVEVRLSVLLFVLLALLTPAGARGAEQVEVQQTEEASEEAELRSREPLYS